MLLQKDISQDLGGHNAHRSISIDHDIPRNQPNLFLAVLARILAIFLVRECLDRSGVDHLSAVVKHLFDEVVRNECLSRSRGRSH